METDDSSAHIYFGISPSIATRITILGKSHKYPLLSISFPAHLLLEISTSRNAPTVKHPHGMEGAFGLSGMGVYIPDATIQFKSMILIYSLNLIL
jgi:hypothetical protein